MTAVKNRRSSGLYLGFRLRGESFDHARGDVLRDNRRFVPRLIMTEAGAPPAEPQVYHVQIGSGTRGWLLPTSSGSGAG
jgi:hypothetical protein